MTVVDVLGVLDEAGVIVVVVVVVHPAVSTVKTS